MPASSNNKTKKNTIWQQLTEKANNKICLNELFQSNSNQNRTAQFSAESHDLTLDFSKQLLDTSTLNELINLAHACELSTKISQLQSGSMVNPTENRAALHTALRLPASEKLMLNNNDINHPIQVSLNKTEQIVDRLNNKIWRGFSGKAITDVVNIGVGGSDLGPLMCTFALEEFATSQINTHFVSSIDGTQLSQKLKHLNPETCIFIISSKSFTTIDTMSNAQTALAWICQSCQDETLAKKNHFIGISSKPEKMTEWGIHTNNQLLFWDWVGGRFSLWSAIGLSIAIKIGMRQFRELLQGAHEMDCHFKQADFHENMPVLLGLIGVWNSSFLGISAHSVLPYDGRLKYFPSYLTQLEMESNGKSVTLSGNEFNYHTCPILWGEIGSNAQHAFYQLLHQGTQHVSCDFIAPIARYGGNQAVDESLEKQHKLALANCLAQSRVLAFGNQAVDEQTDNPHKQYRGNQPSSTILLKELSPKNLGALIALYEHKVFVMSVIWDINPFDQWGVELGKKMATALNDAISNHQQDGFDDSTNYLLTKINGHIV